MSRLEAALQAVLAFLERVVLPWLPAGLPTAPPSFSQWLILAALWLAAALYSYWFRQHRIFNLALLPLWLALAVWALPWRMLPVSYTEALATAAAAWLPLNVLALAVLPTLAVPSWRLLVLIGVLAAQLAGGFLDWGFVAAVQGLLARADAAAVLPAGIGIRPALYGLALVIALIRWRWQRDTGHLAAAGMAAALPGAFAWPFWSLLATHAILLLAAIHGSHRMAFFDRLTGIPNRRALDLALADSGRRFALAMIDVDHFKKINDRYGHDFGDEVLRAVSMAIAKRRGGRLFRYGGEEFCLLIQGRRVKRAEMICEAIRETVAALSIVPRGRDRPASKPRNPRRQRKPAGVPVTVSIGLAWGDEHNGDAGAALTAADAALYKAKQKGRNRVVL